MNRQVREYLNIPATRKLLGVMTNNTFTIPNLDVNTAFVRTGDEYGRTPLYVASLLERGIRVLIYVGEND